MAAAAICIPVYKNGLSREDVVSLSFLRQYLDKFDWYFLQPEGLGFRWHKGAIVEFPRRFFESPRTYSRLLLRAEFYRKFLPYECVLIYQLDALVLSDKLDFWATQPFDYLGAPWFRDTQQLEVGYDWPYGESGVGNGGLSLRRIRPCIEVLEAGSSLIRMIQNWICSGAFPIRELFRYLVGVGDIQTLNPTKVRYAEDLFWGLVAPVIDPRFRVAPVDEAVRFAFELGPEHCLERTNGVLPFGCHDWYKNPRILAFWQEHVFSKASFSLPA